MYHTYVLAVHVLVSCQQSYRCLQVLTFCLNYVNIIIGLTTMIVHLQLITRRQLIIALYIVLYLFQAPCTT